MAVVTCPTDLIYYEMAWSILLATEADERVSLVNQAVRDFDTADLIVALSLAGLTMKSCIDLNQPITANLRANFLEMAKETITDAQR